MNLELDELIQSDIKTLKRIAWFIYNEGQEGLSRQDVEHLVKMLRDYQEVLEVEVAELKDEAYQMGYERGFEDAEYFNDDLDD